MKRIVMAVALLAATFALGSCSDNKPRTQGIYMLLDTSGTYTRELDKAKQLINALLSRLNPGDTFAVASINSASFTERDIVAKVTFDDRPSVANQQKRQFQLAVDRFIKRVKPSGYTDITGGVLQASEFLNEKQPGHKMILIFSDLAEDLKKGYVRNIPLQLDHFTVVALNVTKLHKDNVDPRIYLKRLETWQNKVEKGGGKWQVINDVDHIERLLGG